MWLFPSSLFQVFRIPSMPTYDYKCDKCSHTWEMFQSIIAKAARKCPACKATAAKRVIGPGAGILFKGSGFYQTDYRSDSYKRGAEADKKSSEAATDKPSTGKSESTPAQSSSETASVGNTKTS
jgi:putative FmdB family regulatory protein